MTAVGEAVIKARINMSSSENIGKIGKLRSPYFFEKQIAQHVSRGISAHTYKHLGNKNRFTWS